MSYSGTWYHGQSQGEVAYHYQQPNQYNQYNQQPNQYDQYHNQYQQPHNSNSHPQQQNAYQSYEHNSRWDHNQQQSHSNYDDRSSSYAQQPQQQWRPAHAAYAPPNVVQHVNNTNMHYQYSDLHGKRKALLIGINYYGGKAPLRGCINDVHNVKDFLTQGYKFQQQNMWIMTDDQQDPRNMPTRANILQGMQWLVAGARPGDDLFLHYSGHGGPVKDLDGDEDDGYDEAIFPVDADTIKNGPGFIVDDLIHDICVKPLPEGCRLTAIFDCCHSGSIMDLPYMYSTKGVLKEPSLFKDTGKDLLGMAGAYHNNDLGKMVVGGYGMMKRFAKAASGHHKKVKAAKTSAADVICFSGCKDVQTSADATIAGQGQGAMSAAFKQSLVKYGGNLTYIQLLNAIRQELADSGFDQKPQLSACHPIDLDLLFTL